MLTESYIVGHWIPSDKNFEEFVKRTFFNKKLKTKYWDYFLAAHNKKWGQNTVERIFSFQKGRWEMRSGTSRPFVSNGAWLPFQASRL